MTIELKEAGVSRVISKPFQVAEILALKSMIIGQHELKH
jgi:hypothetical protein